MKTTEDIMKETGIKSNLIDYYVALLEHLSHDHKLELIAKLSNSLKKTKRKVKNTNNQRLQELSGAFIFDNSPEDFIKQLKENRKFNRKPSEF